MKLLVILITSYLIGAIPFSYVITKLKTGKDLRKAGDGNVGAQNAGRIAGPFYGVLAAILDSSKGFIVALIASRFYARSSWIFYIIGISGMLGHQFPIYLGFRGGKAIAYTMGFLIHAFTLPTILGVLVFLSLLFTTKRFEISLAMGIITIPLLWMLLFKVPFSTIFKVMVMLTFIGIKKWIDLPYEAMIKSGRHA